jgi:hypothetical protein
LLQEAAAAAAAVAVAAAAAAAAFDASYAGTAAAAAAAAGAPAYSDASTVSDQLGGFMNVPAAAAAAGTPTSEAAAAGAAGSSGRGCRAAAAAAAAVSAAAAAEAGSSKAKGKGSSGSKGTGGGGSRVASRAISETGHTCRGRVRQKSHKTTELVEVRMWHAKSWCCVHSVMLHLHTSRCSCITCTPLHSPQDEACLGDDSVHHYNLVTLTTSCKV